jgi:hypothetical protein
MPMLVVLLSNRCRAIDGSDQLWRALASSAPAANDADDTPRPMADWNARVNSRRMLRLLA